MLSPKKCLLYVALRTLVSSRLTLSAPGPTSADLTTVAAEEGLARARDPPSIDHSTVSMAIGRKEEDAQGRWGRYNRDQHKHQLAEHESSRVPFLLWRLLNSGSSRHLRQATKVCWMEFENEDIRQSIYQAYKRVNHKIMMGDTEASSVSQILRKLEWIRHQSVNICRHSSPDQASQGVPMTALGSPTSAGGTKEIEFAEIYHGTPIHDPVVVEPIREDPADIELLAEYWGKTRLASLKALSNQAQSEFHSSLVETILALRSFMAKYFNSSDFLKISRPLKPEDLTSVIKLFVLSRIQLLKEMRLFLSSRSGLFLRLLVDPENFDRSEILLRFMMKNKTLEPFHMDIEALDDEGKKGAVLAFLDGMKELQKTVRSGRRITSTQRH